MFSTISKIFLSLDILLVFNCRFGTVPWQCWAGCSALNSPLLSLPALFNSLFLLLSLWVFPGIIVMKWGVSCCVPTGLRKDSELYRINSSLAKLLPMRSGSTLLTLHGFNFDSQVILIFLWKMILIRLDGS